MFVFRSAAWSSRYHPSMKKDHTLRALVGERTYDVVFRKGHLLVDEEPVAYTFDAVSEGYYSLLIEGQSLPVVIESVSDGMLRVTMNGRQVNVRLKDEKALLLERFGLNETANAAELAVHAPMPGLVLSVMVEPGQQVQEGDGLVVLEAMKMENELRAQADGIVKALHVSPGDAVGKNALLLEFES
ncbi:MAG: biotin/lipoyl-containing protein [Rhodothermales bacterium]